MDNLEQLNWLICIDWLNDCIEYLDEAITELENAGRLLKGVKK